MPYADKVLLKHMASRSLRGIPISDLICQLQEIQDESEDIAACPNILGKAPDGCTPAEWIDEHLYFNECQTTAIIAEIERRERLIKLGIQNTSQHVIQAIKAKLDITEVLSWYTEVFTHKSQWTYRCKLHGDGIDKHPSGAIYRNENRFWCFVCNKGGDIVDAVCYYERIDIPQAIRKLSAHVGLEPRPLKPKVAKKWGVKFE